MSTTTTNYALVKPALTDPADITALNSNWDKIDTTLKKKADLGTDGKLTSSQLPTIDMSSKVNKTGDTLSGPLHFNNPSATRAISKIRTVEGTTYFMDVGMGVYSGKATSYMRLVQGSDSDGTQLYRMDITPNGVLLQNTDGKTFWLGGGAVTASVES